MGTSKGILTVGTVTVELSFSYGQEARDGISLLSEPPILGYGGAGGGQALALAKLGYKAPLCTMVGEDANGKRLLEYFSQNGVDTRFMEQVKGGKTAVVTTLKKEGEDEQILLYPGQTGKIPHRLILDSFMSMPDALSLRAELPFDTLLYAAGVAEEKGIPVFLDANSIRKDFFPEELPSLEILSLSEEAVQQLTGIEVGGTESSVKAVLALTSFVKAKYFVFRLGARGCFLFDGKIPQHIAPYRMPAFDYSISGDGFTAALVGTYLETDGQIRTACEYANGAMAFCAAKGKSADPYPSKQDILQVLHQ